jgi:hypothetical protein
MSTQTKTDDEYDWELLRLATGHHKFAIQLSMTLDENLQRAFERGVDRDWFTLVDVAVIAAAPQAGPMKIFKLTNRGIARLRQLKKKYGSGVPERRRQDVEK